MRILIVDDDKATRLCLDKVLGPLGEVVAAGSGQEALDAFENARAEGKPFKLVCLDIIMPGLDGHATLRAMRELEKRHGVAPGQEYQGDHGHGLRRHEQRDHGLLRGPGRRLRHQAPAPGLPHRDPAEMGFEIQQ